MLDRHQLASQAVESRQPWATVEKMVNSIIIDRCKLIGKGIYGTVFEGTWKGTWKDKKVAVKRIQIENVENNQGEEALQKLDHPNVVKLYHVESNSDFRWILMQVMAQ